MKTILSKLGMLQNVQYTLSTNSDVLYPISNEILAFNKCINKIHDDLDSKRELTNSEVVLIKKVLLPEFKFIASVLRNYAVMTEQADILCNCKLKDSNIEQMTVQELFVNLSCYINFSKDRISFLTIFGLTEEYINKMENKLEEINSILKIKNTPKNNSEINKIISEAEDMLLKEIDSYFKNKRNQIPHLYKEYS